MKKNILALLFCLLSAATYAATLFPSRTDFRDEQIYFVMTTRFYDGDASNNTQCWEAQNYNQGDPAWRGDFKGLIEKMDYIKALGFTAIWITPVVENASGYDYHGYHASNFSKVDHRYESEDVNFQTVINEAHKRGMKIILDIVLNHTGNFGEENLCKLFTRDWSADQSSIDDCMIPYTKKEGGKLPDNYLNLPGGQQYDARLAQMKNTDGKNNDKNNYWHHYGNFNWDDDTRWWAQIAGDCVDLNTENAYVANYLVKCYGTFIAMGVDGFRIDTGGHISRLTFNKNFIPQFRALAEQHKAARNGGDFFMFAEVCARDRNVTYRGQDRLSAYFYTWTEKKNYAWDNSETSWNSIVVMEGGKGSHTNVTSVDQHAADYVGQYSDGRTSQNALLNGNTYHTPDYSQYSGLSVIDFPMHWNFRSASEAWGVKGNDNRYNDATWNVVYVDSHDYAPDGAPESQRFSGDQSTWAENLALMFTFRGIPCVYYGSEIEFKKGCVIDKGPNIALQETGRAYFGGYIKGELNVTDFAEYNGGSGNIAQTLKHPLSLHIQRLAKIRMAVPALRKGQYSTSGCSGQFAFKRRYTDASTDSYALVTISGGATFSNIENGTYVDCVTGDTKTVTNGTLSVSCSGKGNMRVYVLNTNKTKAPGKIGTDGKYLYTSSSVGGSNPSWDGTQEELTDNQGGTSEPEEVIEPCLTSSNQRTVFFTKPGEFGKKVNCYIWSSKATITNAWPGSSATYLGDGKYRFDIPASAPAIDNTWKIIWNDGSNQTGDLTYTNQGMYTGSDKGNISCTSKVTAICEGGTVEPEDPDTPDTPDTPVEPEEPEQSDICLQSASERVVFFEGSDFGTSANVYMWDPANGNKQLAGAWPGTPATYLGDNKFKFVIPASATGNPSTWMIIWNGNGKQTADLAFTMHGLYNFNGLQSTVTTLCEGGEVEPDQPTPDTPDTPDTPVEPEEPEVTTGITVKAKMPAHWTNTITAWVWADGMDGQAVTPTKDGEWYVVTENTTSLNIIFRNGTDWNGDANQTVDITGITTNTCYQLTQEGGAKATYTVVDCESGTVEPEEPEVTTSITVKAKMPAHWTNTITAWVWADGMDGQAVTPNKEGEWYVVTKNTTSLNIIFRNGTDWNGNANQTEDITGITTNTCYQLTQEGDAKATYTVVNCEDNTATDLIEMQEPTLAPIKVIINNALYLIMPNGDMYDTAGRLIRF